MLIILLKKFKIVFSIILAKNWNLFFIVWYGDNRNKRKLIPSFHNNIIFFMYKQYLTEY